MDPQRAHNWIETGAAIAVVLGIILVIYELRQNREAVMSQLTNDSYFYESQLDLSLTGEEPAEALYKACYEPHKLTKSDLIRLEAIYSHRLLYLDRLISLSKRGSFYSEDYWKSFTAGQLGPLFATEAGRNYWSIVRQWWHEELRDYVDEFLERADPPDCIYDEWENANRAQGQGSDFQD